MNLIEVLKKFERPIEITQEAVDFAFNKLTEEQQKVLTLRYVENDGKFQDTKDMQRVGELLNKHYSVIRALEIKGLRKILDLIPQYYFNKENVIVYLKEHTKDETIAHFKVTKKLFNEFIEENNIQVLYERRTEITKGLIPVLSPFNKLTGKRRDKYNNGLQINKQKEKEIRNNIISEKESELGVQLAKLTQIGNNINKLSQGINFQKSLIECLNKCDYVSYIEEEAFGNHKSEDIEIKELLSDNMIINYIVEKYGIDIGLKIKELLN